MKTDPYTLVSQAGVRNLRVSGNEIWGSCPNHSPDADPSWSINRVTLLHHCFACHYSGTLTSLLIDLTGSAPADLEDTLRTDSFLRTMAKARQEPEDTLAPVLPILTDWALLNILKDVPRKLLARRWLQRAAVDAYGVRWQPETRQWVLPLRSPSGDLLGAQYRQVGSVLTLPEGVHKGSTLFGLHFIQEYDQAVLVESPLDAVRLFGLGIPAIASLGAWVSMAQIILMARAFSVMYIALDDDKAGRQGAAAAHQGLRKNGCASVPWLYRGLKDSEGHKVKDLGDVASDDALLESWDRTQRWGF
jgi:Toprim-like/CHC2 zinc finger